MEVSLSHRLINCSLKLENEYRGSASPASSDQSFKKHSIVRPELFGSLRFVAGLSGTSGGEIGNSLIQMEENINKQPEPVSLTLCDHVITFALPKAGFRFYKEIPYVHGQTKMNMYWQILSSNLYRSIESQDYTTPFVILMKDKTHPCLAYIRLSHVRGKFDPQQLEFYVYQPEFQTALTPGLSTFLQSLKKCLMLAIGLKFNSYFTEVQGVLRNVSSQVLTRTANRVLNDPVILSPRTAVSVNMRTLLPVWWLHQTLRMETPNFQIVHNVDPPTHLYDLLQTYFAYSVTR